MRPGHVGAVLTGVSSAFGKFLEASEDQRERVLLKEFDETSFEMSPLAVSGLHQGRQMLVSISSVRFPLHVYHIPYTHNTPSTHHTLSTIIPNRIIIVHQLIITASSHQISSIDHTSSAPSTLPTQARFSLSMGKATKPPTDREAPSAISVKSTNTPPPMGLHKIGDSLPGGDGCCYLVEHEKSKVKMVKKVIKNYDMYDNTQPLEKVIYEQSLRNRHRNIIYCGDLKYDKGSLEIPSSFVEYFEYCEGGGLLQHPPVEDNPYPDNKFVWQ